MVLKAAQRAAEISTAYGSPNLFYRQTVFQKNKKVEVCLVVTLAFASQGLRSIFNVAE